MQGQASAYTTEALQLFGAQAHGNTVAGTRAPRQYTVAPSDTLESIARATLGDGRLWYTIAEANGLAGSATCAPARPSKSPAPSWTPTGSTPAAPMTRAPPWAT